MTKESSTASKESDRFLEYESRALEGLYNESGNHLCVWIWLYWLLVERRGTFYRKEPPTDFNVPEWIVSYLTETAERLNIWEAVGISESGGSDSSKRSTITPEKALERVHVALGLGGRGMNKFCDMRNIFALKWDAWIVEEKMSDGMSHTDALKHIKHRGIETIKRRVARGRKLIAMDDDAAQLDGSQNPCETKRREGG